MPPIRRPSPGGHHPAPAIPRADGWRARGEGAPVGTPDPSAIVSPRGRFGAARTAAVVAVVVLAADVVAAGWASTETAAAIAGTRAAEAATVDDPRLPDHVADAVRTTGAILGAGTTAAVVACAVTAVLVVRWQLAAVRNLRPMGVHPRRSPGASAWSWVVPVWQLVGPPRTFGDLWRAAEPDGDRGDGIPREHWRERGVPWSIAVWWTLWLVGVAALCSSLRPPDGTLGGRQGWIVTVQLGALATIVALGLVVRLMAQIGDRHDARRDELARHA